MIEGSGSVSLTNGSGCGSGKPKTYGSYGFGSGLESGSATLIVLKDYTFQLLAGCAIAGAGRGELRQAQAWCWTLIDSCIPCLEPNNLFLKNVLTLITWSKIMWAEDGHSVDGTSLTDTSVYAAGQRSVFRLYICCQSIGNSSPVSILLKFKSEEFQ
jgi:hypothetical protein